MADPPTSLRTSTQYFFLSYARRGLDPSNEEPAVRGFFGSLLRAVERLATRPAAGEYDQLRPPGNDAKHWLSEALSTTQVFVPLYSPTYFVNPWTMREHGAFQERVTRARARPGTHIVPVLWTPFVSWRMPEEARVALDDGPDLTEYRTHGLEALGRLDRYHSSYEQVVRDLAARIVRIAEQSPLPDSAAPDVDTVSVEVRPLGPVVAVSLLLSDDDFAWSPTHIPGRTASWWRDGQLPGLTRDAITEIEQLGLGAQLRTGIGPGFADSLGMLLVDPWLLAQHGPGHLSALLTDLPDWVTPYILRPQDTVGRALADEARTLLSEARPKAPVLDGPQDLLDDVPRRVARLRRTYFEQAEPLPLPDRPTTATRRPPRLGDRTRWRPPQENPSDE